MDFQKAVELINQSKRILVTTHTRADGDACGSMAALNEAFTAEGKECKLLMLSAVPQWYKFLFDKRPAILGEDISLENLKADRFGAPDLVMIIDTNSHNQLPGFSDYLKENKKPVLVIDHHITSDGPGDVELIDTTAAATAVIVFDLFKSAGWQITRKIAVALFAAIATDTGWFQFPNTNSKVHQVAAELTAAGVDSAKIYQNLYQNFTPARFRLMTAMLNSLELYLDGRYAAQQLTQTDFEKSGASQADTENLIDQCRKIAGLEAAALFIGQPDGKIRCSLRSRGTVDVREIAQKFGGGGHKMAAGTHITGSMQQAKKLIYDEIKKQLK